MQSQEPSSTTQHKAEWTHSRLGIGLRILLLGTRHLSSNNVLPDIIFLGQVEELPDLGRPLGPETLRQHVIGQTRDLVFTLLDDDERKNRNIRANDAATDGLALAFAGTTGAVTRVAVRKEEANTVGDKNTLLHGETLLVVTASDTEDIALPLVTERVTRDFLRDLLVVEDTTGTTG